MTNMIFLALSLLHSNKPSKTEDIDSSMFFPEGKACENDGIIYIGPFIQETGQYDYFSGAYKQHESEKGNEHTDFQTAGI